MSRVKAHKSDVGTQGQPTYIFAANVPVIDSQTGEEYWVEPGLENLDTGIWMLITVPIARRWSNGQRDPAKWTTDRLHDVLAKEAKIWNRGHPGPWIYHPRKVCGPGTEQQPPVDPAQVRADILAGPDCGAKRFLERLTEKQRRDPVGVVADAMRVRDEPGATEPDMEA